MKPPKSKITANLLYLLELVDGCNVPLSAFDMLDLLREEDEEIELRTLRHRIRNLEKKGYFKIVPSPNSRVKNLYSVTEEGKGIIEKVNNGEIEPWGNRLTSLVSIGTCEKCGRENCDRTRYKVNGKLLKICRDCLMKGNDEPVSLTSVQDGFQKSALHNAGFYY